MKKKIFAMCLVIMIMFGFLQETVCAEEASSEEQGEGYHFLDLQLPEPDGNSEEYGVRANGANLPEKYDARSIVGFLPEVRNQGNYDTCWAFAALASAEASLIKQGYAASTLDLSEYQLAYFFYHHVTDPLGNTEGDATNALTTNFANQGGNSLFTMWALAGWQGPALEEVLPYSTLDTQARLGSEYAYQKDYAHLQNAYLLNTTDLENIKKMIMEHGAVNIGYRNSSVYSNEENHAYYNPTTDQGGGHAVTIVGWDDTFSKNNFNQAPPEDGAWLIRNSWGTDKGEGGYFWLSYYDASLEKIGYVFDFSLAGKYDYNYQYDGSNGSSSVIIPNGGMAANVFQTFTTKGYCQSLSAVSIGLYSANVDYTVSIYMDPQSNDPTSGQLLYSQTGRTEYTGYYTIPLEKEVTLIPGHTFSIVYTLSKDSGDGIKVFVDKSYPNHNWISFVSQTSAGQSYVTTKSGWYDLNNLQVCARIKAFSKKKDCLHAQTETKVTPADASLGQEGNIQVQCADCTEILSNISISAPDQVILENAAYLCDGTVKEPSIRVLDKAGTTVSPSDYTVTWQGDRKNPGTHYALLTFRGNYKGTMTASFTIGLDRVKKLKNSSLGTRSIKMKWNPVNGAAGYQVYRYDSNKKRYVKIKTLSSKTTSYQNKSLKSAKSYKYKIRAYRTTGTGTVYGDYSEVLFTATKPTQVKKLKTEKRTKTSIKLKWKKVSGASGYQIYRYHTGKKKWKKVKVITKRNTTTYTNKKLKSKKNYKYKVRAYKQNGKTTASGTYSSTLKVKTR